MLRLHGELASHAYSVVLPLLLPDAPVVVWWPDDAPEHPSEDKLGTLAQRRITDAAAAEDPIATLRQAVAGAFREMPADELAQSGQRAALVLAEPALRSRSVDNFVAVAGRCRTALAESTGRDVDDPGVAALVGAFTGVLLSVAVSVAESGDLADLFPRMDAALARLEGVDWFTTRA